MGGGGVRVFRVNTLGVIHLRGLRCIRQVSLLRRVYGGRGMEQFRIIKATNLSTSFSCNLNP
jgi:hypothetical protein